MHRVLKMRKTSGMVYTAALVLLTTFSSVTGPKPLCFFSSERSWLEPLNLSWRLLSSLPANICSRIFWRKKIFLNTERSAHNNTNQATKKEQREWEYQKVATNTSGMPHCDSMRATKRETWKLSPHQKRRTNTTHSKQALPWSSWALLEVHPNHCTWTNKNTKKGADVSNRLNATNISILFLPRTPDFPGAGEICTVHSL